MGYPGGKAGAGVYQRIINQIPPHDVYVEPCLGDGAVLRRKRPAARTIGVEIDAAVAARFAGEDAASGGGDHQVEVYCCCGIEWLKHTFALYRVAREKPTDHATAAAVAGCVGVGRPPADPASHDRAAGSRWFVYFDPPYLLSTRRSRRKLYRYEMTPEQHEELLDVANQLPCPVAISGYWSPLYAAALQKWRSISFNAVTRGNRVAREFLWMNYPEPAELHDYRYLGDEKRERERIARKVRTWAAGLQRLPDLERQAILAEAFVSRGPINPAASAGGA